jgi:hypothetical protein
MLASILIIAVSIVLLVYWFRYTCLLLLRDSRALQSDARFSFGAVRERLQNESQLDPLSAALERDYQLITYLLQHASGLELDSIEERMLLWDYRLMRCWYRLARIAAPLQAKRALSEMATVLSVLGGKLGERAGVQAEV